MPELFDFKVGIGQDINTPVPAAPESSELDNLINQLTQQVSQSQAAQVSVPKFDGIINLIAGIMDDNMTGPDVLRAQMEINARNAKLKADNAQLANDAIKTKLDAMLGVRQAGKQDKLLAERLGFSQGREERAIEKHEANISKLNSEEAVDAARIAKLLNPNEFSSYVEEKVRTLTLGDKPSKLEGGERQIAQQAQALEDNVVRPEGDPLRVNHQEAIVRDGVIDMDIQAIRKGQIEQIKDEPGRTVLTKSARAKYKKDLFNLILRDENSLTELLQETTDSKNPFEDILSEAALFLEENLEVIKRELVEAGIKKFKLNRSIIFRKIGEQDPVEVERRIKEFRAPGIEALRTKF